MNETFEHGIYIDGSFFKVPVLSCKRNAKFIWKFAERDEEGEHQGEILGVYFNYSLSIGQIADRDEYNRLYEKLTEPNGYHQVSMPSVDGGMFEFTAYFDGISDEVKKSKNGKNVFRGLKVDYVSKRPARKP